MLIRGHGRLMAFGPQTDIDGRMPNTFLRPSMSFQFIAKGQMVAPSSLLFHRNPERSGNFIYKLKTNELGSQYRKNFAVFRSNLSVHATMI